jgi:hypothetical protein
MFERISNSIREEVSSILGTATAATEKMTRIHVLKTKKSTDAKK